MAYTGRISVGANTQDTHQLPDNKFFNQMETGIKGYKIKVKESSYE